MPEAALPPGLRLLKWLVIVLTVTMIVGVITVVAVLVTRIPQTFGGAVPALPATLAMPQGLSARAVTTGQGWLAVVAADAAGRESILIFTPGGRLRQRIALVPEP